MSQAEVPTPLIDGFSNLRFVGIGGFSRVFSGTQDSLGRQVALKVLNFNTANERERRAFERECRAMGAVSTHPNIVTVHQPAYTTDGQPCIVMEFYAGGTLNERLKREGALPISDVLDAGVRLSSALGAAHQEGLIHRDIKPQNLFISSYGEPALGDFGISAFNDEMTMTGSASGGLTMHYAPPEVIESETSDERSDVYSLAASLYTLAAGRRPFDAEPGKRQSHTQIALRVLDEDPPVLGYSPDQRALDPALRRAMAKDRNARPGSAWAFGESLQEVQSHLGLPVTPLRRQADLSSSDESIDASSDLADPAVVSELPDDQGTMTVARSRASLTEARAAAADAPDAPQPRDRQRIGIAAAIGLLSLLVFLVAASFLSGKEDRPSITENSPITTTLDTTLPGVNLSPPAPTDVRVRRASDGTINVSWQTDADDLTFDVVEVDDAFEAVRTESNSVGITGVDPEYRPCVIVQASRNGAVAQSETVCLK